MNYIERYVYAVKKHLPAHQKEDVGAEIKALILEQVSEEDDFQKIEKVLKDLGSPRKLAHSYRNQNRSLIGPEHFELYLDVLKIALKIVISINIFFGIVSFVGSLFVSEASLGLSIGTLFEDIIGNTISSALTTFGLVTLGFVVAIHFKWLDQNDEWMLKDLPELPKKPSKAGFSLRKTALETLGVGLGMAVLLIVLRLPWLAFDVGGSESDLTILTPANYAFYFPIFLGLLGFYLINQLIVIQQQGLSRLTLTLKILHSLSVVIVMFFMFFMEPAFLRVEDLTHLAELMGLNVSRLEEQINLILGVFLVLIAIGLGFDRYKDTKRLKKESSSHS